VYLAVRNLFALVWLLARPRRSKELEILVLRHELAMLRRQARQPRPTRADRALLAALSRSLPRIAWAGFSVKPETLLRWHRLRSDNEEWSLYGAPWLQPVATSGRWRGREDRLNRRKPLLSVATGCLSRSMVKSMFATACHRLPTIPFL
jgi:hypothetical protein